MKQRQEVCKQQGKSIVITVAVTTTTTTNNIHTINIEYEDLCTGHMDCNSTGVKVHDRNVDAKDPDFLERPAVEDSDRNTHRISLYARGREHYRSIDRFIVYFICSK